MFFCDALRQLLRPNSEYILPSTASRHIRSITFTVNFETYVRCKHDRFLLRRDFDAYVTTTQLFRFNRHRLLFTLNISLAFHRALYIASSYQFVVDRESIVAYFFFPRPLLWRLSFAVYISPDT